MNPTVEAALIAAVTGLISITGTVVVAVAGFRNTKNTAERATKAEHEDRLWENRNKIYQEAIAYVHYRQLRRKFILDGILEKMRQLPDGPFEGYQPKAWLEIRARLVMYGSTKILREYSAGQLLDIEVYRLQQKWWDLTVVNSSLLGKGMAATDQDREDLQKAKRNLDEAIQKAEVLDTTLVLSIRGELGTRDPGQWEELAELAHIMAMNQSA